MVENAPEAVRAELSPEWVELVMQAKESSGWVHGFAVYEQKSNARIGNGGFKGPPTNGEAEIAYGIDEPYRGRGFATSVAQALTRYAFGQDNSVTDGCRSYVAGRMSVHESTRQEWL